ncbi:hypothetical protein Vi05172_g2591 [Venturia inaequalis]|nr:hypothetical protein Vi05172_g2591 [Venturia inaequalis]
MIAEDARIKQVARRRYNLAFVGSQFPQLARIGRPKCRAQDTRSGNANGGTESDFLLAPSVPHQLMREDRGQQIRQICSLCSLQKSKVYLVVQLGLKSLARLLLATS